MSISYKIPHQSYFIQTANLFAATFNAPTIGRYDFNVPANTAQTILALQPNTVYFIDRCNVGGTIAESDYLESIVTLPTAQIKFKQGNEAAYRLPIPIVNYIDNQEFNAWISTDKGSQELTMTFRGVLKQTAALVGVSPITIQVSLNLYQIHVKHFTKRFREQLSPGIGSELLTG